MKNENYKEIDSFEKALAATGRPAVPAFADAPDDLCEYFKKQYKAIVITEAINGGWKPDMYNTDQEKWFPWFRFDRPSGFAFGDTCYGSWLADAGDASRLCFKTEEQAEYAGETFPEIYEGLLTK